MSMWIVSRLQWRSYYKEHWYKRLQLVPCIHFQISTMEFIAHLSHIKCVCVCVLTYFIMGEEPRPGVPSTIFKQCNVLHICKLLGHNVISEIFPCFNCLSFRYGISFNLTYINSLIIISLFVGIATPIRFHLHFSSNVIVSKY